MAKHEVKFEKEDFERLQKLMDSGESSFSLLALHSLIEREMRMATGYVKDHAVTFNTIGSRFLDSHGKNQWKDKQLLNTIENHRKDTNDVRHRFELLNSDKTGFFADTFFEFVDEFDSGAKNLIEYTQLRKSVDDMLNDVKKIAITENEFVRHQEEHLDLLAREKDYKKVLKDNEALEKKLAEKEKEIEDTKKQHQTKIRDQNSKIDKLRSETHELKEKLKKASKLNSENASNIKQLVKDINEKEKELAKAEEERTKIQKENDEKVKQLEADTMSDKRKLEEYTPIVEAIEFQQQFFMYSTDRHHYLQKKRVLTKEQRQIVDSVGQEGDYMIRGGAGSGKTLVLLEILNNHLNGELFGDRKCRFLTFTNSLTSYSKAMCPISEKANTPEISTVNSFISKMANKIFKVHLAYQEDAQNVINRVIRKLKINVAKEERQGIIDELTLFIWAKNVKKEVYLSSDCQRRGMKEMKSVGERAKIWQILEAFNEQMEKNKEEEEYWPYEYAVTRLIAALEAEPERFQKYKADYIFLDECQDLSMATLILLKKLSTSAIYLAGDFKQSIYKKAWYSMSETGINIRGRSKILGECFRSTRQICAFSESYKKLADLGSKEEKEPITNGVIVGHPVGYFEGNSEECLEKVCAQISNLLALNIPMNNIAVITYTNDQEKVIAEKLKPQGIYTDIINANTIKSKGKNLAEKTFRELIEADSVKLLTIHNVKGLEFPYVIFYASEDIKSSEMSPEVNEIHKKNLVYVASTRAITYLYIAVDNTKESKALGLIKEAVDASSLG